MVDQGEGFYSQLNPSGDRKEFTLEEITDALKQIAETRDNNKRQLIVYFGYNGNFYNTKDHFDIYMKQMEEIYGKEYVNNLFKKK